MNKPALDAAELTKHRDRLREMLPAGAMGVVGSNDPLTTNADGTLGVFPNSDLLYLTGIRQEETSLLLFPDARETAEREILFLRRPDPATEVWEGSKLTPDMATEISGIQTVRYQDDFPALFHRLMCECQSLYLNLNEHPRHRPVAESRDLRFARWVRNNYPLHDLRRLAPLLHKLRRVKSPAEIEAVRAACDLTARAFRAVRELVAPGVTEKRIEAEFARIFTEAGARFAYQPIIASGASSCVLHYVTNAGTLREGDVLLIDVGAELGGYCADLTRVLPIGGRFTARQQAVHDAVQRVHCAAVAAIRPGALWKDIHEQAIEQTADELDALGLLPPDARKSRADTIAAVKKYFMHGIGHPLGLDVHDVGDTALPLETGCIMTVEPGIYIPDEGFGIRIETNVVVTPDGCQDLFPDV